MTNNALTLAMVKDELRDIGMTIRVCGDEYRVNFEEGAEATAYYTPFLDAARVTADEMARNWWRVSHAQ